MGISNNAPDSAGFIVKFLAVELAGSSPTATLERDCGGVGQV